MTGLAGWVVLGLACLPIVALGLTQATGNPPGKKESRGKCA